MPAANLSTQIKQLIVTPEPPELGPGPRSGVQPLAELRTQIKAVLRKTELSPQRQELVEATVLLWHDHHDPAHVIAQNIENPDGSYVHGILHRREPDYNNARYWFRRVGTHVCFAKLAEAATALLAEAKEDGLKAKLIPRGEWDAYAFIEACERAASKPGSDSLKHLLREIQRAEFEILLDHFCQVQKPGPPGGS